MKGIVLLVGLAMGADLLTFSLVVPIVGIGAEMNPVMAAGYARIGLGAVVLLKALTTLAILLALLRVRTDRLRWLTAIFAASIGILGTVGNLTAWATSG